MGKKVKSILNFVAWLTGVIVSLAVGFAMIDGVLYVRWIPSMVTMIAGWIVVISTLVSAALVLLKQ